MYRQVQFNFRITYFLPLILFWVVLFFQQKSPVFVWLAGITAILAVPGSAFYPLVIVFYSIAIFTIVLLLSDRSVIRAFFRFSWPSLIAFTSLLVILVVFLYYFGTFSKGVDILRGGRGPGLYVPISDFFATWRSWNPITLAVSFLFGVISIDISNWYEYIFYIGLLPLAGVIASILYQRSGLWYAILAAAVFLYAISLKGYFTFAGYFLPYVDITRYIAILGTIPFRTFLILIAGFGLDKALSSTQWKRIGIILLCFAFTVDILGAVGKTINGNTGYQEVLYSAKNYTLDFKIFWVRVAAYLGFILLVFLIIHSRKTIFIGRFSAAALLRIGMVVITVVDLGLYRYNLETKVQSFHQKPHEVIGSLPGLQQFSYQGVRFIHPPEGRVSQAVQAASLYQAVNP